VRRAAADLGIPVEIRHFGATTRTAADAAREIGCDLGQIIKSLVFFAGGEPVLALCSGTDRVDEARLAGALGVGSVRRATPAEARAVTGFPIGGTPPFALHRAVRTLVDPGLLRHLELWAGAGTGEAVVRIYASDLIRATGGDLVDIATTHEAAADARP
jgi:prolyl-tRNA editing enzyme YbaK/EbsC (Cys-tRNA(Pro) deacylase)